MYPESCAVCNRNNDTPSGTFAGRRHDRILRSCKAKESNAAGVREHDRQRALKNLCSSSCPAVGRRAGSLTRHLATMSRIACRHALHDQPGWHAAGIRLSLESCMRLGMQSAFHKTLGQVRREPNLGEVLLGVGLQGGWRVLDGHQQHLPTQHQQLRVRHQL